jgi:FAD:protein FMN transferase
MLTTTSVSSSASTSGAWSANPNATRIVLWLVSCCLGLGTCATVHGVPIPFCQQNMIVEEWSGKTMGPIDYVVKVVAAPESDLQPVQAEVSESLDRINRRMSTYLPDSEISRFNATSSTDWFPVSGEVAALVQRAQEISQDTDGAFDITVKPAVERWNFGANRQHSAPPDKAEIEELRQRIGFRNLQVRLDPPALKKSVPELQIDVSAIAKGYAVDVVFEVVKKAGFSRSFVEIGGELRTGGTKPDDSPWIVGVEKPLPDIREIQSKVAVRDAAMATSGDYRNFRIVEGKWLSHTIDPKTAEPVDDGLSSVTVIASDCLTADAYATALMVAGPSLIEKLEQQNMLIMTIKRQGPEFAVAHSRQFPFVEQSAAAPVGRTTVFLATLGIFLLVVLAMAVGAMAGNRPIQGSCGGLAARTNPDGSTSCSLCQKPTSECPDRQNLEATADKT